MSAGGRGAHRRKAPVRRPARPRVGPVASDLVIVSRALADLADFLRVRQEAAGRGRVILDRREGNRRVETVTVERDRRHRSDRRRDGTGAEALLRVLGFTVVPSGPPPAAPAPRPAVKRTRPARAAVRARRADPPRRARRRR